MNLFIAIKPREANEVAGTTGEKGVEGGYLCRV